LTVDQDERMIGRVTRISILYDFYAKLLTDRQREMLELHNFDDWSLSEIAQHYKVSRQAVHDNLRRAEEQLEYYEAVLQLYAEYTARAARISAVRQVWAGMVDALPPALSIGMQQALDDLTADT